jgi:AcrR family transcriptional regulator
MTLRSCDPVVTIRVNEIMPKDTFLNLPEGKRRLIEDVALDVFAEFGFDNASINRIVTAAGIAKGSFYQYFEDKADLFKHIMVVVGIKKAAYISPVMLNPDDHDFFTLLEELNRSGLAFAKDHPKINKIGFEVYKNQSNQLFDEIYQESRVSGYDFMTPLIDTAIARGEVDPDIDKPFIIHMLLKMQLASIDFYLQNHDQGLVDDDIMPTIHLMINFIKNGIQRQKQGALTK